MGTEPRECHDAAIDHEHHNGMVDGLQGLGLDEEAVKCLGSLAEFRILEILANKGLHHTDGRDVLLHGAVQVVVFLEHLGEELHGLRKDEEERDTEDDERNEENLKIDKDAHQHRENHVERCPHGNAHQHLEGVLQVRDIGGKAGDESRGGKLVDVGEREGLNVLEHGITKVVGKSCGCLGRAAPRKDAEQQRECSQHNHQSAVETDVAKIAGGNAAVNNP